MGSSRAPTDRSNHDNFLWRGFKETRSPFPNYSNDCWSTGFHCIVGSWFSRLHQSWGRWIHPEFHSACPSGFPSTCGKQPWMWLLQLSSVTSVAQSCLTLCNPMNHSMPGLPVHHQLREFTQTHVHQVGDAIQPSHPLSSPSPPAPNPSQHQGLFQWVNSSHHVTKVLEFQL